MMIVMLLFMMIMVGRQRSYAGDLNRSCCDNDDDVALEFLLGLFLMLYFVPFLKQWDWLNRDHSHTEKTILHLITMLVEKKKLQDKQQVHDLPNLYHC